LEYGLVEKLEAFKVTDVVDPIRFERAEKCIERQTTPPPPLSALDVSDVTPLMVERFGSKATAAMFDWVRAVLDVSGECLF
jgi:hypothetical protein